MTLIFTVNISLHRTAYNSDLVHPYLLLQDLLADPTALLSWQLSPAIYVFPDWLLAGLLVAIDLPNFVLPLAYGGFLLASYGFLLGWLLVAMRTARWPEAVVWGCLGIAGLFMASNSSPIGLGGTYLSFIATAYIHSGAVFAGFLLIPLLTEVFYGTGPAQQRARWAVTLLIPLACYSDLVFVAWFAAPVCTVFLVAPTPMPNSCKRRLLLKLGGLGVLAVLVDLTRPSRVGLDLDHNLLKGFGVWRDLLVTSFQSSQWQIWIPLCLLIPMVIRGFWLLQTPHAAGPSRSRAIELCVITVSVSSVLLPFLSGAMVHESKLRYSLPVLIFPWVWLLQLASQFNTPQRRPGLQAAGVALACGCLPLLPKAAAAFARIDAKQHLQKMLEDHNQQVGYGDYWTAKPVIFETNRKVHCIPLLSNGQLDLRNYNARWFTERAGDAGSIEPTFVVTSRLNEDVLTKLFGEPDTIEQFRKNQFVWFYNKPLPLIPSAHDNDFSP